MSIEKRNYDEELRVLLHVAKENSFLIQSSFTNCLEVEQATTPTVYWIDTETSVKEAQDANT
ncbi:MAG: hypothetical protein PHU49_06480 [Syntrophorhabdaceae bacterium]|nr:hypothetical protein [Syntrophorhabdaceae bacterium]